MSKHDRKIINWLRGPLRCPKCTHSINVNGQGFFEVEMHGKKPWLRCVFCNYTENREEFLVGRKRGGRKHRKKTPIQGHTYIHGGKVQVPVKADDKCEQCNWGPTEQTTFVEWDVWTGDRVCPICQHPRPGNQPTKDTSVIVYEKGKTSTFNSYDDYMENKAKIATTTTYAGQQWQWKSCGHVAVPIPITADGVQVYAYAWKDSAQKDTDDMDYFVALDSCWLDDGEVVATPGVVVPTLTVKRGAKFILVPTPDYQTPKNLLSFVEVVNWMTDRAKQGDKIGIGCMGGHGRTGMFIAAMMLAATPGFYTGKEAVDIVRNIYCEQAVESLSQENLVDILAKEVWGSRKGRGSIASVQRKIKKVEKEQANKIAATVAAVRKAQQEQGLPKYARIKMDAVASFASLKPYLGEVARVLNWVSDMSMNVNVVFDDNKELNVMPKEYEPATEQDYLEWIKTRAQGDKK